MDGNFWIFGGIVSVGAHLAILLVFLIGSCERQREPEVATEHPVAESPVQEVPSSVPSSEVHPVQAAEIPRVPTSATATPKEVPSSPPATLREYEVRPGDTLSAIARRNGCMVAELAEANKSSVRKLSRLRVGQRLILPE